MSARPSGAVARVVDALRTPGARLVAVALHGAQPSPIAERGVAKQLGAWVRRGLAVACALACRTALVATEHPVLAVAVLTALLAEDMVASGATSDRGDEPQEQAGAETQGSWFGLDVQATRSFAVSGRTVKQRRARREGRRGTACATNPTQGSPVAFITAAKSGSSVSKRRPKCPGSCSRRIGIALTSGSRSGWSVMRPT